jgi:SAM-dependent methyltransferase
MTPDRADPSPEYVLGHSDRELERLSTQARLVDPITREFFVDAGIAPGMRILDVGSGSGDVAFLASELAGDKGSVVGVDRAPPPSRPPGDEPKRQDTASYGLCPLPLRSI